jgi:hypothetical protein
MKNTHKMKAILIIVSVAMVLITFSCSKERVEPKESRAEYQQLDDYYNSKKQQEQEFEIDGSGNGPIIGKQGTKIWESKEQLMYANGDSVQWPFTIKLVELYTPEDMIWYEMPSVSDGMLLSTAGEVRVRAFKGDEELVLRPDASWTLEMPNASPDSSMKIYYGSESSAFIDWTANPADNFQTSSYGYIGEIKKMGWVACSKEAYNSGAATIYYSFTSSVDNLDNAGKFLWLPDKKGLMQVYGQNSGALPIGENMKIILIAQNDSSQLFDYYKETQVSSDNVVDVTLTKISDSELTAILDGL